MSSRLRANVLSLQEPQEIVERIVRFIQTHASRTRARFLIVGMSGGLDSSVTAALCSKAVGGQRTLGFCLPEDETSDPHSIQDADEVAKRFGIRLRTLNISRLTLAMAGLVQPKRKTVPWGNVKARLRAMILYYYANSRNGLVVGTGDKSEVMLGYFTKYGDGACDLQPLADLYKTAVRELARHIGLPSRIYSKPSTPELWPGQTAEGELGLSYEKVDRILWGLERWMAPEEISGDLAIPVDMVSIVKNRWLASEHKRRPPITMKLGFRTTGQDLRIPNDL